MTTNMIRADMDLRAFYRWAGARGMISRGAFDPGFAMHCLLTESFGREMAPKPFRMIIPRDRDSVGGTFYAYSPCTADDLRETAEVFACPLQSTILPAQSICDKAMPESWRRGRRLGFEVLVRPIVRCGRGSGRPGSERDAFQAEAERHPRGESAIKREDVYRDWLSARLARSGASLKEARLRSFRRVRVVRKLGKHASEGPDAVMQGTLEVTDPTDFAQLIASGIGRHRAYGYGMLLLRPASSSAR